MKHSDIRVQIQEQDNINALAKMDSYQACQQLRIEEKIRNIHHTFKPLYYQNLKILSLQMEFSKFSMEQKEFTYLQITKTFIINQQSQVKVLKLVGIDLKIFINSIDASLKQNFLFNSKIQDLNVQLSQITEITQTNVNENLKFYSRKFINIFFESNSFDLQILTLSKFDKAEIISSLLNLPLKTYSLKKISLIGVEEELSDSLTIQFIEEIFTCQKFKIESLQLDQNIQFKCWGLDLGGIVKKFSTQSPLQEFTATIDSEQIDFYAQVLQFLFTKNNQLKKLDINLEKDSNFNDLFSNLFNYQNNQLSLNFRIEELILNGKLIFDSEMFQFLLLLMNRLRLLEISDVVFEPSSLLLQNLKECEQRRQRENSLLRIKYISNQEGIEIKDFMEYFIFNDKFGFEQVEVQDKYSFVQTKIIQNFSKLKSIKLHMRPQERKQQLWDFNVFTSFSKSFIYNLESNCEEICFYNFEFTNNEINALIQPAKQFKQLLNGFINNNQNKLNLKKFSLRHSRNLIDENIEKIIDNLIFFEYIFLKELTLSDINLNNKTCQFLVDAANQWMKQHRGKSVSQNLKLPLKILDLSQNHFIQNQETWENLLKRFIFTLEAKLKAFIISDMSLTDKTTECFKNLSEQFFQAQQCKYQLALRALDLSQNYFLSQIGWLNILKYFALSKNVEIVELNMNETTEFENNEEILNQIYKCFEEKANLSQNQKVSIQRVYCQNENLKVLVSKFLAPYNQQQVYYLEQKQRDNFKLGMYYGFGEYFGTKVQTYNIMLKEQNEFIELKKIDSFEDLKLSYYQLNFSKHYLQILNNYYKELEKNKIDIYLSLLTLKNFCSIFQYPMNEPAEPFPYKLFFQQDTMNFLKSQSSLINRINFIQTDFGNLNLIQQGDIFNIWKQIRETSIDLVIIEYTMNDELCQNMIINGFNERDIIQLIRVLPPSKVRLIGGLSLCAIKGVYSILYEIPHFQHSFTSYEYDLFLNTGIGYSLRESVYQWKERNFIEKIFKRTLYKIFNFFVSSKNKYTFDQEIIKLNQFLKDNQIIFFVIATNNNIFWFVALVFPYLMISKQLKEENETSSDVNCASISYTLVNSIYYFCFSPIFFFIETILFYFFSQTIGNHIDTFEFQFQALADESYDEKDYQFISNIDQQDNEQIIQNHKNIQLKRKTKWFLPQLFFEGDQLMEENLESSIEQPQQTMEPQQTIKSSLNQIYPLQSLAFRSERYISGRKIFPQEFLSSRRKSSKIDFGQFKFTKFFKKKWKTIYGKYRPINFLKKKLNELFKSQTGIIVYSFISIIKSQLYKFDLFNDMIFILTCFYCQEVPLFYASILITMLNQLFYLTQFLLTGFSLMKTNDKVRDISTQKINQMYSLALVGRNQAIADLLDKITPFNVSIIPNTYFFRKYFPRYAGKSISNPVMYYFVQFWCEDLPQTVLQAYFAYKQQISDGFLQTQIYIMILTTTFTLLSSFYSFMSIRPSNITQEDFDRLAEQKKAAYHKTIKSWLEEEKKQLEIFSNIS